MISKEFCGKSAASRGEQQKRTESFTLLISARFHARSIAFGEISIPVTEAPNRASITALEPSPQPTSSRDFPQSSPIRKKRNSLLNRLRSGGVYRRRARGSALSNVFCSFRRPLIKEFGFRFPSLLSIILTLTHFSLVSFRICGYPFVKLSDSPPTYHGVFQTHPAKLNVPISTSWATFSEASSRKVIRGILF